MTYNPEQEVYKEGMEQERERYLRGNEKYIKQIISIDSLSEEEKPKGLEIKTLSPEETGSD